LPRSPKTSLIAHAKTSSRTDGFFCEKIFKIKRRKAGKMFSLVSTNGTSFVRMSCCDIILLALRFFQTRLYYLDDSQQTYVVISRTNRSRDERSSRNRGLFEWNMTTMFT
jgi:hypothetical protein